MSLPYTPQVIYCNACGGRMETIISRVVGRNFKRCSMECVREMEWRSVLSDLGKPYHPRIKEEDEK